LQRRATMLQVHSGATKRPSTIKFHSIAVQRVIHMIRERLDNDITLKEMAALAYMSRCHFSRTFRQITGLPPRLFLSKLRVEAAARMLLNSDSSVTEICLNVGYSSLGTFISRFSEALGISPTKLRMLRHSPLSRIVKEVINNANTVQQELQPAVTGRVYAPSSFSGPIFLGLFPTPIPEGKPIVCAVNLAPGEFLISPVPPGDFYIFALGLAWPQSPHDFFRYDVALRAGGQCILVENGAVRCEDIFLRCAAPTDPPVLLNLLSLLDHNENQELKSA
jgi:AraC family transcriptional regulator